MVVTPKRRVTPLMPNDNTIPKKEGKFKGRLKKYHKNHAGMNYAIKLYKEEI